MDVEVSLYLATVFIAILLILTIGVFCKSSGFFAPIEIRAGQPFFNEFIIAYKFARGPYKNASELFTQVHSIAPSLKTIGVYYDDPKEIPSPSLRYVVGAIISDSEGTATKEDKELLRSHGFNEFTFPNTCHAVLTEFPFTSTLSIFIAILRIYPKLSEFIKAKSLCAHPFIEIYDRSDIKFIAPLSKQDEFYVPEAKEDEEDSIITSLSEESLNCTEDGNLDLDENTNAQSSQNRDRDSYSHSIQPAEKCSPALELKNIDCGALRADSQHDWTPDMEEWSQPHADTCDNDEESGNSSFEELGVPEVAKDS